jgi:hypothetical protein
MNMWGFHVTIKNKKYTHEIAMIYQSPIDMNIILVAIPFGH